MKLKRHCKVRGGQSKRGVLFPKKIPPWLLVPVIVLATQAGRLDALQELTRINQIKPDDLKPSIKNWGFGSSLHPRTDARPARRTGGRCHSPRSPPSPDAVRTVSAGGPEGRTSRSAATLMATFREQGPGG